MEHLGLKAFNDWYEKADDRRLYPAFKAGWDAADRAAEIVPSATNADGTVRLLDMAELKAANAERVRRSAAVAVIVRLQEREGGEA